MMPTSACSHAKCRRPNIWPAGTATTLLRQRERNQSNWQLPPASEQGGRVTVPLPIACDSRVTLDVPRRRANALNIEVGTPAPRCLCKPPSHWPVASGMALRWIASGGSALVFGSCSQPCPLLANGEV